MSSLPTKLYIIGNGFDIWHGIPSSYRNFRDFVGSCDSQILDDVEKYLNPDENWSDLEAAFGYLDTSQVIDDLEYFMPSYAAEDWSES